jgi:hypothetical protein
MIPGEQMYCDENSVINGTLLFRYARYARNKARWSQGLGTANLVPRQIGIEDRAHVARTGAPHRSLAVRPYVTGYMRSAKQAVPRPLLCETSAAKGVNQKDILSCPGGQRDKRCVISQIGGSGSVPRPA